MPVETVLATHGIDHNLLPSIMGFLGPQMEVDKTEVKVLHCFLFMRRFEQKLADKQVEFQMLWFMSSSQDHTRVLIEMIPKSERKRMLRRILKICSGLIETNPSEELKLAQNHFFDTWVGKNTTCAKIENSESSHFGHFVMTSPYIESVESLKTRLENYKIVAEDAIDLLEFYNPPDGNL